MKTQIFGKVAFSQPVQLYELENKHGMQLSVISYGARIVGLKVPSLSGELVDVVVGFKTLEEYEKDDFYFGAIIGRVAGRIHPSNVQILNKAVHLVPNKDRTHSNAGKNGFDTAIWTAEAIEEDDRNGVSGIRFRYVSPDGSEGYPGELVTEVEYRITNQNELIIKVKALTEEPTIIDIASHAYFNLGGKNEKNIYGHMLTINADLYLLKDEENTPTGDTQTVENPVGPSNKAVYDFRNPRKLREAILDSPKGGFDDTWCLSPMPLTKPRLAATLYNPANGVNMDVLTTQPGLTLYTGNLLEGGLVGKYGETLSKYAALCLQTQHYPNSVNIPTFPSSLLKPGETYSHTTIFRFSTHKTK